MAQLGFELNKAAARLRSDHPETSERIDALALAVDPFPDIQSGKDAVTAPLKRALQERRTAGLFKNYASAFRAINAPKDAASVEAARSAVTAPTATHAVPLFALYTVLNVQPAATGRKMQDPGQLLEANFNAEPDRAWKTYQERSTRLKDAQQLAAARKVLDAGLAYFQNAEEVWPDAIRFYGEAQGWDEARRMAANCGRNFRRVSQRCAQAASSPAELAEAERKSKVKAEQIVDNMFKKK